MQEASVSSTTSSPHKITKIATENQTKEPSIKVIIESKESSEDICGSQICQTESRNSHHSRRRTHTCSKAGRLRSKSSDRKESRKPRNRRRHHRSRRSRSRSHYHSSSRRQHRRRRRRHYATESSSYSSSYQSSSRSRSPSRRSQHRRRTSSASHLTDLPNCRSDNDVNETNSIFQHPTQPSFEPPTQISVPELSKDTFSLQNGLPKLISSNPAFNGIVSFLLNSAGSNNALSDLFGSATRGLVGSTCNQTSPPPNFTNTTRQARRLYIGSIPLGITPENMVAFFNTELQARGLCQSVGDPVVCAQVNSERHFAFIELRSVEETTAALSLDGINCLGSTLRIRRPRDYFPPGSNPSTHSISHLNANAIFLTGIPSTLSEQNLFRLLSAYGTLRSFNMLRVSKS
ncbi:unnamed protein product [Rodentolepis nana]|uniref:RRM domain-containing protein n=1 Tax=Rodentolepis nana TaxID=102285 RepID=A0A0R3T2Z7_RODNA|nr:unnamed protein product [Rodentolepis nana]